MTYSIPAPQRASRSTRSAELTRRSSIFNKRGEERSRAALFIAILVFAVAAVSILIFGLVGLTTKTSTHVLDQQKGYSLTSDEVVKALYAVDSIKYSDETNTSCTLAENYRRPVVMTLRLHSYEVPQTCTVFFNNVVLRTYSKQQLDPDCIGACTDEEFNRQFSLGEADYRDNHVIRVCCNSICVEQVLPGLCGKPIVTPAEQPPPTDPMTKYLLAFVAAGLVLFIGIFMYVVHQQHQHGPK